MKSGTESGLKATKAGRPCENGRRVRKAKPASYTKVAGGGSRKDDNCQWDRGLMVIFLGMDGVCHLS